MSRRVLKIEKLEGGTFNQKIEKVTFLEEGASQTIVRKEAKNMSSGLIKEINFLKDLDEELKVHFPQILDSQVERLPIFYEMPFYELRTLRELISKGEIKAEACIEIIKNILVFMFEKVYTQNLENNYKDYLLKTVFSRIEERFEALKKESLLIKKFVEAKKIIISGKEYKNIPELLNILKKDQNLLETLIPKKIHRIHGDFHFDNFLVDPGNINNFILIDPRGETNGYSYDYDLGKLWFSFHGKYDLLTQDLFKLKYELWDSVINVPIFEHEKSVQLRILEEIYSQRQRLIDLCKKYVSDQNLESQILFNEAIHFCALAPFQIKNDNIEKVAIGKYLTGVKLLNQFMGAQA